MMGDLSEVTRLPDDFDGRVRLFPLPNLVMFPHAMQPLHIFEPRYCEMLTEALQTDQLIAMATLADPTSPLPVSLCDDWIGTPPLAPEICLGKIVSHAEVEDDRHNILLVGIRRARITAELDLDRTFRMATIDLLDDMYSPAMGDQRIQLQQDLMEAFGSVLPPGNDVQHNLAELMNGQMGLGPITDIISYTLPFGLKAKLDLLCEADVDLRASKLIKLLQSGTIQLSDMSVEKTEMTSAAELEQDEDPFNQPKPASQWGGGPFPPPFSLN
ncbi:MAG: LON peptidase substrate-binding domain-containing protein [Planctomycetota bacterium]